MEIQRRRPPDNRDENDIITGMIINREFLAGIRPLYRPQLFRLPWVQRVASWCVEFHDQYQTAPQHHIEDLFRAKTAAGVDPDTVSAIEVFLTGLSDAYARADTFNARYQLDRAERYLRTEALQRLREQIGTITATGELEEAERVVAEFAQLRREDLKPTEPLIDPEPAINLLARRERMDGLIRIPGLLGTELGMLDRGQLWAIIGETGAGKSWWLQMLGLIGAYRGYNVVRFDFEMTREQHALRVAIARTGRPDPLKAGTGVLMPRWDCKQNLLGTCPMAGKRSWRGTVGIDLDTERVRVGENTPPDYAPCEACRSHRPDDNGFQPWPVYRVEQRPAITAEDIRRKATGFRHRAGAAGRYIAREYPSGVLTVKEMRTVLKNMEYYDGVTPDVIVVDYADKIRAENTDTEYRHQLRQVWEGQKALAQEFNALNITASQSNTARTGKQIGLGSWAESMAKAELIDGGFAIQQQRGDRGRQIYKCLNLKQRHDEFESERKIAVLSCLKIGRPYIDSTWSWPGLEPARKKGKGVAA
jgi:replicative DNA helicase